MKHFINNIFKLTELDCFKLNFQHKLRIRFENNFFLFVCVFFDLLNRFSTDKKSKNIVKD